MPGSRGFNSPASAPALRKSVMATQWECQRRWRSRPTRRDAPTHPPRASLDAADAGRHASARFGPMLVGCNRMGRLEKRIGSPVAGPAIRVHRCSRKCTNSAVNRHPSARSYAIPLPVNDPSRDRFERRSCRRQSFMKGAKRGQLTMVLSCTGGDTLTTRAGASARRESSAEALGGSNNTAHAS